MKPTDHLSIRFSPSIQVLNSTALKYYYSCLSKPSCLSETRKILGKNYLTYFENYVSISHFNSNTSKRENCANIQQFMKCLVNANRLLNLKNLSCLELEFSRFAIYLIG